MRPIAWAFIGEFVIALLLVIVGLFLSYPTWALMVFSGLSLQCGGMAMLTVGTLVMLSIRRDWLWPVYVLGAVFWLGVLAFWGVFIWLAVDQWKEPGGVYAVSAGASFVGVAVMAVALWLEAPRVFGVDTPGMADL